MRKTITIETAKHEKLIDITESVRSILKESGIRNGMLNVYAQGATAAMMI